MPSAETSQERTLAPVEDEAFHAAALRLHRLDATADEITATLSSLVVELKLAEHAVFLSGPAGSSEGLEPTKTLFDVEVGEPGGAGRGVLRCTPVDSAAADRITILAAHAGVALATVARLREAARREASARRIAEHLQDAMLPLLPTVSNATIAVSYRPATREAKVGGDFYDVFRLPTGKVLLAVGDVVGKGVEAAVHTSKITHTMRSLALTGMELDQLLERLDEHITWQNAELMATIWCGFYDPSSGELAFASLGHPPALLLRDGGDPIRLELEGLPLGLRDLAERPPEIRTRQLGSRDLLVLYTDGVVEASKDYLAGQEALLNAVVSRRSEPVGQVLEGALDELLADAGHSDDAVMLLLRRA